MNPNDKVFIEKGNERIRVITQQNIGGLSDMVDELKKKFKVSVFSSTKGGTRETILLVEEKEEEKE